MFDMEILAINTPHNHHVQYLGKRYTSWCDMAKIHPFPVTSQAVGGFVCSFVNGVQGSTKSVDNVVSGVKMYCLRFQRQPWLPPFEADRLKLVVDTLKRLDSTTSRYRAPATLDLILVLSRSLRDNVPADDSLGVFMFLAHDGMFRAKELLELRVKDISFPSAGLLSIHLRRTKTIRAGDGVDVLVREYQADCGYRRVVNFLHRYQLWRNPDAHLFPSVRYVTVNFSVPLKAEALRQRLKALCCRAGYGDFRVTGHSFRAGGATDLFNLGVPFQVIQKQGRWKSDAVLLYFKADALDISSQVSAAFNKHASFLQSSHDS